MNDIYKFKKDIDKYNNFNKRLIDVTGKINKHKINISIELKSNPNNENLTKLYNKTRDTITEITKCLIFMDEFFDRLLKEETIIKEEIDAMESIVLIVNDCEVFEKKLSMFLQK